MKIALIGTRTLDLNQKALLAQKGMELSIQGNHILSGNALGADQAWVSGLHHTGYTLYLPWDTYEPKTQLPGVEVKVVIGKDISETYPYWDLYAKEVNKYPWDKITQGVKRLMARNLMMIKDCDEVWAAPQWKNGESSGGTAFGIFLARTFNKSYNLLRWYYDAEPFYFYDSYGPPDNTYIGSFPLL